ncbi:O-antigen ligase family protein [Hydrogenophaga sp. PAMC20947]|uniref:O-antigen ligase family protein n=1 Tax=Hydrogenophaga sp. PAMC20947 TaxID=2565558 RepID=UPI00109E0CB7|nr:O-antigen ligase family protein [Hydrogenophaga sp. PAMC20947]QCB47787.1 hypothetical protein E5678_18175 [Hydrogenophaga sp. PAMC20947]
MIEAFLVSRFISDYFWEFKILSASQILIIFVALLFLKVTRRKLRLSITGIDLLAISFTLYVCSSYLFNANDDTLIITIKFCLFLLAYFAGRMNLLVFSQLEKLSIIASIALLAFLGMGLLGVGYQDWGGVSTFTAGYFFKSDLALSACMLLTIILSGSKNIKLLSISWLSTMIVVLQTNARVFIPIVFLLPIIAYLISNKDRPNINYLSIFGKTLVLAIAASLVMYFGISAFSDNGDYLVISTTDFFSASNTQGRSVIWDALIAGYLSSDLTTQLFGAGLDADRIFVSGFAEVAGLEDANAHNIYLYILVSLGLIGLIFCTSILLFTSKIFYQLLKSNNKNVVTLSSISISYFLILLVAGLTTDAILRPQIMAPFCFFLGLSVKYCLRLKNKE